MKHRRSTFLMASSSSSTDHDSQNFCFLQWISQQEEHLTELLQPLTLTTTDDPNHKDLLLKQLTDKNIKHFQDYIDTRTRLTRQDISPFFAPTWCTSLENSLLWLAECRPSSFIRLVYAICGSEIEAQIGEFLQGVRTGNIGELSGVQLIRVNDLQTKIIREEEKRSTQMASLQEEIADQPIWCMIAGDTIRFRDGEPNSREAEDALDEHARSMLRVMEGADQLRLSTLKELMGILTPVQAVSFLTGTRKLRLCIHEWGEREIICMVGTN